jgi:hypothetical protein
MPRITALPKLDLSPEEITSLRKKANSLSAPLREVKRAQIILHYLDNVPLTVIAHKVSLTRSSIYKCITKTIAMGVDAGLHDTYHAPKLPSIDLPAKQWIKDIACIKPKELGYAAELWTLSELAKHARTHALAAGYPCLTQVVPSTIHGILHEDHLQPHKIRYYLERRDPKFEEKMRNLHVIYQEINAQLEGLPANSANSTPMITVSVDEKPGVQAIKNIAPDLPPTPEHPTIGRDYEYKRDGTVSILAALDLLDGHIIAQVHDRHRSREFIALLQEIDEYYPATCQIRVILDNHSAHISKETMAYLAKHPGRFIYVHTPTHGSWLNLVETLFSKMARTFLKGIRVASKSELKRRILKGIAEINDEPVIHRWKKFDVFENMSTF